MTVGELIKVLTQYDEDKLVILAADPEGNYFDDLRYVIEESVESDQDTDIVLWP